MPPGPSDVRAHQFVTRRVFAQFAVITRRGEVFKNISFVSRCVYNIYNSVFVPDVTATILTNERLRNQRLTNRESEQRANKQKHLKLKVLLQTSSPGLAQ